MNLQPTKTDTFGRARVVVAEANSQWGNTPYTRQPGQCGEEGDFIHLTPEYLLKPYPSDDKTHKPRE